MARRIASLVNKSLSTADGELGSVKDFLFDDHHWSVRYLVTKTGSWLTGRSVLIAPEALIAPVGREHALPVNLTAQQVADAPGVDTARPVSRQQEGRLRLYYDWPLYWAAPYDVTLGTGGTRQVPPAVVAAEVSSSQAQSGSQADPRLRSVNEVNGYYIEALDGAVGHVEDFVVDEASWKLSHFIVDTRNWLPGRKVVLPVKTIISVNWEKQSVTLKLTRAEIENAPTYDPDKELDLQADALGDYYEKLP